VGPGDFTSDGIPVWSPDGQRVAFVSGRGGQYDLYLVSATGGAATRLTEDSAMELPSDWRRPR
jgi:tricorn protease